MRTRRRLGAVALAVALTLAPATAGATGHHLLPQTTRPWTGKALTIRVRELWHAIRTNDVAQAGALFFPLSAYVQVKAIYDPAADFRDRLWAFYLLDLAAYHAATLDAGSFIGDRVNLADMSWIPPGGCENRIGYWHLPGVRLLYHEGGTVRSVGIFSFISWRGVWYVVHLGPNPRPADVGAVDAPALGPGVPGGGGC